MNESGGGRGSERTGRVELLVELGWWVGRMYSMSCLCGAGLVRLLSVLRVAVRRCELEHSVPNGTLPCTRQRRAGTSCA